MLTIRLIRVGKKNAPSFRVVLTEKTAAAKSGSFLEILGHYNPRLVEKKDGKTGKKIKLDADRIKYWLSQGAQTSDTVHNLLVSEKVIEGEKIKKKIKPEKGGKGENPAAVQPAAQSEEEKKSASVDKSENKE